MNVAELRLDAITIPSWIHRRTLDPAKLRALADSIATLGLLNPITVERAGDHYELRAGHRRLEAHRLLRKDTIHANIIEPSAHARGEPLTWAENLEREDLSPIEQAEACARMRDRGGLSVAAIARACGRSAPWVEQRLELLDTPAELQDLVHAGELPMGQAIELARITDPAHREHLTRYALLSGASFLVIKDWVAQWRLHAEQPGAAPAPLPPLPADGERAIVLIPCTTCGEPHPPHEHRVVHICTGCMQEILDATSEWRKPAPQPAQQERSAPRDAEIPPPDYDSAMRKP